ncbi:MAG TPA: serine/threonine-protein kinase [Thermoanaerobaculia bacterium]|nr:serine/threonine-protein kinase [Thermoanaerobaculia bacterium]
MSQITQITCLRCKQPIDSALDQCPACGERVTSFQRTYSARLIDGKYQILDRLGVGGMGEIFKVRHIHLNELRVIKIMRPNVAADDQGLHRFLQEARTSTTIKHRNLAMLYDFAQLDDGSYYMVWEFIDGVNIQKWIATNGPAPPRLAVEIAVQALTGLDHLHSMGLIHRDISPENIMLSQDHHGKLLVKVIDFGIAKSLAEGEAGQGLTQTGMFLGKLKYASPEQAGYLKEGEHLDPRSDLYSFGIVMYEMLAGRAPFQATNPHGYILKHVTEKPAPIAETNPQVRVPPQLESIIMKSLEKSRDNRFRTAGDFANALEAVRASIPPDQKYGLGERMVTLSAAKTLAELPKYTGTVGTMGSQPTQQTFAGQQQTHRTSVTPSQNEATMVTSQVAQQRPTLGSNDATMVERLGTQGSAAPTAVESKFGAAEPTLIGRLYPQKKNRAVIGAIAAALIIAIAIAAYVVTRPTTKPPVVTETGATSGAIVTSTATPPVPRDRGVLLLSASPWGDVEKIVNMSNHKAVDLTEEKRSTPTAIELDPGMYSVTVRGPNASKTVDVNIEAGKRTRQRIETASVNYDELEREVKPQ